MRAFWLRLNIHLCDLCDSYEFISRNYLLNILTILTLNHWAQRNTREKTVRRGKKNGEKTIWSNGADCYRLYLDFVMPIPVVFLFIKIYQRLVN